MHLGECEFGSTRKYNLSGHREDSVEAGVRLINDEENEDEFNVILRQQSAEDESSAKGSKPEGGHSKNHHSNGTARHHQTNRHHNRGKQLHHSPKHSARHQSALHRKQRSQLCRKLKCRFNSICKLDQSDLNQTHARTDGGQSKSIGSVANSQLRPSADEETVELNRISLEVIAYCDCSHIACDSTDREKSEELCGSDGKLYQSACQMKEKSCKLQTNIHIKQRTFCDQTNRLNESTSTSELWLQNFRLKKLSLYSFIYFCPILLPLSYLPSLFYKKIFFSSPFQSLKVIDHNFGLISESSFLIFFWFSQNGLCILAGDPVKAYLHWKFFTCSTSVEPFRPNVLVEESQIGG